MELLRGIAGGDRRSFEEFYDRFSGVMFSTAYRVLNNEEAAEDVLQDVFVFIWDNAPLYNPARGKPMTWVLTLTRHKAIDRLRAIQRQSRLRQEFQHESETFEQFNTGSSLDEIASAETGRLVRDVIRTLPKDQREVIELAFFQSLTHTEISQRLKTPLGTVKARIRRGMISLREKIGGGI